MDTIPLDIWPNIFNNLSINDLLNCRLVNKKFKDFSENVRLSNLVINNSNYLNDQENWFNNKLIKEEQIIEYNKFIKIRWIFNFTLERNLKFLKINCNYNKFNLNELSNFMNLECLEINCRMNGNQFINLINLKIFIDKYDDNQMSKYYLNTPKLRILDIINIKLVNFNYPKSVKHIITQTYDDELELLINLEIMELKDSNRLNENLFTIFKNLNKLKIYDDDWKVKDSEIEEILIKLLKNKSDSNLIYYQGVKLININQLNEYESCVGIFDYQIKNYNLLDSTIPEIKYLNYNQLENYFNDIKNELPLSFFDKYFKIIDVYVDKEIKNENNFIWFLENLKNFDQLELSVHRFKQSFFNNLPNTFNRLTISDNSNINYNFILKLTKLNQITINDYIGINIFNLVLQSFLYLKNLKFFYFQFKETRISIFKCDKAYDLFINHIRKGELKNNELEEFFNQLKDEEIINELKNDKIFNELLNDSF